MPNRPAVIPAIAPAAHIAMIKPRTSGWNTFIFFLLFGASCRCWFCLWRPAPLSTGPSVCWAPSRVRLHRATCVRPFNKCATRQKPCESRRSATQVTDFQGQTSHARAGTGSAARACSRLFRAPPATDDLIQGAATRTRNAHRINNRSINALLRDDPVMKSGTAVGGRLTSTQTAQADAPVRCDRTETHHGTALALTAIPRTHPDASIGCTRPEQAAKSLARTTNWRST